MDQIKFSNQITENLNKKSRDVPTNSAGIKKLLEYMKNNTIKHPALNPKKQTAFSLIPNVKTIEGVLAYIDKNKPKRTGKFTERPVNFWVSTFNRPIQSKEDFDLFKNWALAELRFLKSQGHRPLYAALHWNEATPHLHVCTANWVAYTQKVKRGSKGGRIVEYSYEVKRYGTENGNTRGSLRKMRQEHRKSLEVFLRSAGLSLAPKGTETTLAGLFKSGNPDRFKKVLSGLLQAAENDGLPLSDLQRLKQIWKEADTNNLEDSKRAVASILQPEKKVAKVR